MKAAKLVKMANQIGAFFATQPDHAQAVEEIANHLARTWTPGMRQQLSALAATTSAEELSELVVRAIQRLQGQAPGH